MPQRVKNNTVAADPSKWSKKSQRSIGFHYIKEYRDIPYNCWRCKKPSVFSATDQQYTFEVKKASIDQRRILCQECWKESLVLERDISSCEDQWAQSKKIRKSDAAFLTKWLGLLESRDEYVPYRPNTAAKNMLRKLLKKVG